jgi:histidine triad (HIT) family protein
MLLAARRVARDLGVAESGYRLVMNTGAEATQSVPHLHMHLLGGRPLEPRLG